MQTANDIVDFWREAGPARWFRKDPAFDQSFRDRFLAEHETAAAGGLQQWQNSWQGSLALLILLDQLPRNAFRGEARMFATDAKALAVAGAALQAGHDRQAPEELRNFFYLPFMHSESMPDQQRALALTEPLGAEPHRFAVLHRDIIARFGRFPHRNAQLGRMNTHDEQAFLDEGGFAG
ncbi:MAG: DUF924 family protein [Ramlibacter sp.]